MKFTYITAVIAALMVGVEGHSWIDSLTVVGGSPAAKGFNTTAAPNASKPGFIRAMVSPRQDTLLVNTITGTTIKGAPACSTRQKTRDTQNPAFPRLNAAPGSTVEANYTENGHISLPLPQQTSSGTIYWFGTATPKDDETVENILKWNQAGTGGDKRGRLLAKPSNFDDGFCVETFPLPGAGRTAESIRRLNAGQNVPCKSRFTIPQDVKAGSTYTVYWVWDYSEHLGKAPANPVVEWYTSCMDINIVGGSNKSKRELVRSAKFRLD